MQDGAVSLRTRLILGAAGILFVIGLSSTAAAQDDKKPAPAPMKVDAPKPAQDDQKPAPAPMKVDAPKPAQDDQKPAPAPMKVDAPKPAQDDKKPAPASNKVDAPKPAQDDKKLAPAKEPAPKEDAAKPAQDKKAPAVAVQDAMVIQIEAQYGGQFRRLFRAELSFMRSVTNLKKQEYEKIVAEGEPSVKAALQKFAKRWQGGYNEFSDPIGTMTEAISKSVSKHLSPEQSARYQKEVESRVAARKQMVVSNLVVMVDKALFLSTEQRPKLKEILAKNWNQSWSQTQYFMYDYGWFPPMPDDKILPILTEAQRVVWKSIIKNSVNFGVSFGNIEAEPDDDEVWPEDSPKKGESPLEKLPAPRVKESAEGRKP